MYIVGERNGNGVIIDVETGAEYYYERTQLRPLSYTLSLWNGRSNAYLRYRYVNGRQWIDLHFNSFSVPATIDISDVGMYPRYGPAYVLLHTNDYVDGGTHILVFHVDY